MSTYKLIQYKGKGSKKRSFCISNDAISSMNGIGKKQSMNFAEMTTIILGKGTRTLKEHKKAKTHSNDHYFTLIDSNGQQFDFQCKAQQRKQIIEEIIGKLPNDENDHFLNCDHLNNDIQNIATNEIKEIKLLKHKHIGLSLLSSSNPKWSVFQYKSKGHKAKTIELRSNRLIDADKQHIIIKLEHISHIFVGKGTENLLKSMRANTKRHKYFFSLCGSNGKFFDFETLESMHRDEIIFQILIHLKYDHLEETKLQMAQMNDNDTMRIHLHKIEQAMSSTTNDRKLFKRYNERGIAMDSCVKITNDGDELWIDGKYYSLGKLYKISAGKPRKLFLCLYFEDDIANKQRLKLQATDNKDRSDLLLKILNAQNLGKIAGRDRYKLLNLSECEEYEIEINDVGSKKELNLLKENEELHRMVDDLGEHLKKNAQIVEDLMKTNENLRRRNSKLTTGNNSNSGNSHSQSQSQNHEISHSLDVKDIIKKYDFVSKKEEEQRQKMELLSSANSSKRVSELERERNTSMNRPKPPSPPPLDEVRRSSHTEEIEVLHERLSKMEQKIEHLSQRNSDSAMPRVNTFKDETYIEFKSVLNENDFIKFENEIHGIHEHSMVCKGFDTKKKEQFVRQKVSLLIDLFDKYEKNEKLMRKVGVIFEDNEEKKLFGDILEEYLSKTTRRSTKQILKEYEEKNDENEQMVKYIYRCKEILSNSDWQKMRLQINEIMDHSVNNKNELNDRQKRNVAQKAVFGLADIFTNYPLHSHRLMNEFEIFFAHKDEQQMFALLMDKYRSTMMNDDADIDNGEIPVDNVNVNETMNENEMMEYVPSDCKMLAHGKNGTHQVIVHWAPDRNALFVGHDVFLFEEIYYVNVGNVDEFHGNPPQNCILSMSTRRGVILLEAQTQFERDDILKVLNRKIEQFGVNKIVNPQ